MDWWEIDEFEWPTRYRLCRAGFAFSALGLGLMALDSACHVAWMFTWNQEIDQLLRSPGWDWSVGVAITSSTLIGPYLLLGRFEVPSWRRRAGLLVLLNAIDVAFWLLRHVQQLGLLPHEVGHVWLRMHVVLGSSWVQFALFAALAGDLTAHLGSKSAPENAHKVRAMATAGGVLWALTFLTQTAWERGWPLGPRFGDPLGFLLWNGLILLRTVTSFQAAILCLWACRDCSAMLRELGSSGAGGDVAWTRSEHPPDDPWAAPAHDPGR